MQRRQTLAIVLIYQSLNVVIWLLQKHIMLGYRIWMYAAMHAIECVNCINNVHLKE